MFLIFMWPSEINNKISVWSGKKRVCLIYFPGGSVVKNLTVIQETRVRSQVGKIPWKRAWQPTPVFLENYTDRGAWRTTVHRVAKSQIQLKQLSSSNMLHPQGMQRVKPISEISLGHILSTGDLRYKFIHLMLIIVNILTYSCPHDLIYESLYGNKPGEQSTRCSEEFLPSRLGKGCPCQ